MAKDVIHLHGKDLVVREDRARAFGALKWGHIVVIIGLGLMVALGIGFFVYVSKGGQIESPLGVDRSVTNSGAGQ